MAYNFLACDRDQAFLLPPDLRDWFPADHLAWFILDLVDQLDLGPFLKAYRADGHGRAAYEPRMLLSVLYAYCTGVRSSRQIERRLKADVAFRVLHGRVCYAQRSRWFAVNGRSNLQHLWATGSYASRRRRRAAAERGARHLARRPEPAASGGSGGRRKSVPAVADAKDLL
jgi:hypothetical protein